MAGLAAAAVPAVGPATAEVQAVGRWDSQEAPARVRAGGAVGLAAAEVPAAGLLDLPDLVDLWDSPAARVVDAAAVSNAIIRD